MPNLKIQLELPSEVLALLAIPDSELAARAREWVLLELFLEGEISAGKAAEVLGLSKPAFLQMLADRGLPYLDAAPSELAREVAVAETLATH